MLPKNTRITLALNMLIKPKDADYLERGKPHHQFCINNAKQQPTLMFKKGFPEFGYFLMLLCFLIFNSIFSFVYIIHNSQAG